MDEKKLRSRTAAVYKCLRENDLQGVVTLSEKKDVAHHPLFVALRAIAYDRSGLRAEAVALADDAMRVLPGRSAVTHPGVLSAVAKVWRRGGVDGERKALAAYEAASAAAPEDQVLLREVALSLARLEEWKRLQSVALRLYKLSGKHLYVAWAAWTMHLTTASPTALGQGPAPLLLTGGGRRFFIETLPPEASRPLALAQTLLTRALDALPPHQRDSETLGLLYHTMVRQGRPEEAYKALHGQYAYTAAAAAEAGQEAVVGGGGGGAAAEEEGGSEEEDVELVEGSQFLMANGKKGRGLVPSPFQPVDTLRHSAYLLTLCALQGSSSSSATATTTTLAPAAAAAAEAAAEAAVGSWDAALHAYAALLLQIDRQDWAYHCGLAYCWVRVVAPKLQAALAGAGAGAGTVAGAGAASTLDTALVELSLAPPPPQHRQVRAAQRQRQRPSLAWLSWMLPCLQQRPAGCAASSSPAVQQKRAALQRAGAAPWP